MRMYVPTLGPNVPKRGNAFSRGIGRMMMTLGGWKFEGVVPDEPKFVLIVAPHTSNWDFFVGLWAYFRARVPHLLSRQAHSFCVAIRSLSSLARRNSRSARRESRPSGGGGRCIQCD